MLVLKLLISLCFVGVFVSANFNFFEGSENALIVKSRSPFNLLADSLLLKMQKCLSNIFKYTIKYLKFILGELWVKQFYPSEVLALEWWLPKPNLANFYRKHKPTSSNIVGNTNMKPLLDNCDSVIDKIAKQRINTIIKAQQPTSAYTKINVNLKPAFLQSQENKCYDSFTQIIISNFFKYKIKAVKFFFGESFAKLIYPPSILVLEYWKPKCYRRIRTTTSTTKKPIKTTTATRTKSTRKKPTTRKLTTTTTTTKTKSATSKPNTTSTVRATKSTTRKLTKRTKVSTSTSKSTTRKPTERLTSPPLEIQISTKKSQSKGVKKFD